MNLWLFIPGVVLVSIVGLALYAFFMGIAVSIFRHKVEDEDIKPLEGLYCLLLILLHLVAIVVGGIALIRAGAGLEVFPQ